MKNEINKKIRSLKAKIIRLDSENEKRTKNSLNAKSHGEGFSGSSYNAKGNVDHGKIKSNKKRRWRTDGSFIFK